MKNKYFIFFPSLIIGTLISITSSSWFTAWIGLEINLIRITPIIINKLNYLTIEASIKYFLIQAVSSSILIFSSLLRNYFQEWNFSYNLENIYFITLSLKAGVAPLHFWFPQVIRCSDWTQCIILLTWQKIAPFVLLSFLKSKLIIVFIIACSITGILGGINQTNIKLILVYSSILNSGWLLSLSLNNELTWWIYFSIYSLLTLAASYIFIKFNTTKIDSTFKIWVSPFTKFIFLINFLSLAGLPPFIGFFIKIIAIKVLMENFINLFIIYILVITSLLSFYFYLRTSISSLFINEKTSILFLINKNFNSLILISLLNLISIIGILAIPLIILLT